MKLTDGSVKAKICLPHLSASKQRSSRATYYDDDDDYYSKEKVKSAQNGVTKYVTVVGSQRIQLYREVLRYH